MAERLMGHGSRGETVFLRPPIEDGRGFMVPGMDRLLARLLEHYRGLGMEVSPLPQDSPEALETGLLRRDLGYVRVEGGNFDLVTLRLGGVASGPTGSQVATLQGIPLSAGTRGFVPIEYHHIVRRDPSARPSAYEATLKKRTRGLFRRSVVGLFWRGGSLAAALNAAADLRRSLTGSVDPRDRLHSMPDARNRCVRIVFTRPADVRVAFGVLRGIEFEVTRFLPPAAVVQAIDRIARTVRSS